MDGLHFTPHFVAGLGLLTPSLELALGISYQCKKWSVPFSIGPGDPLPGQCLGRRVNRVPGSWVAMKFPPSPRVHSC